MINSWPDKYRVCVCQSLRSLSSQQCLFTCLWKYIQIEILLEESLSATESLHLSFMTDFAFIQKAQSCRLIVMFDWGQEDPAADSLKMMMMMLKHLSNPALVFHHICKSLPDNESQIQESKISRGVLLMSGCSDGSLLQSNFMVSSKRISHDTEEQYQWNHSRWGRNSE